MSDMEFSIVLAPVSSSVALADPREASDSLPNEVMATLKLLHQYFGTSLNSTSEVMGYDQTKRKRTKPPIMPTSNREDYDDVSRLFDMVFEGSLVCNPTVKEFIFQHIFVLHAFILKMKELLSQKNYVFAAIYDMLQEYLWFKIKHYLFDHYRKLGKGPTHCLVFYCNKLGRPFYSYNSSGILPPKTSDEVKDVVPPNPTPHFCEQHAKIGITLQSSNKHTLGRLFGQLLPEIYWAFEDVKSPDHYRSSLGVFWKQWSVPILEYLSFFNYAKSFRHVADGALVQSPQVFNDFLVKQGLEVTLALRLKDLSQPVISENIIEMCIVLIKSRENRKAEVLNLVDANRLKLVKDHSKYSLRQETSQPTLFDKLASNTEFGELKSPNLPDYSSRNRNSGSLS